MDAITTVIQRGSPATSGTYFVSDSETLSTAHIVHHLRAGNRRPARLIPVPPVLMRTPLQLAGRRSIADSLLGDLEVDSTRFAQVYGWAPPETARDALGAWARS